MDGDHADPVQAMIEALADEVIDRASLGEPGGATAAVVLAEHVSDDTYHEAIVELAAVGLFTLANRRRAFLKRAK